MKLINAEAMVHPNDSMMLFTIEDMLKKYAGACPHEIQAIPINWIESYINGHRVDYVYPIAKMVVDWKKENS